MSIVSPKEISNIRQIERIVKSRFHKSDIPDGAEIVRKRLFYYLEQIETAEPQADFAKLYQSTIHEKFEDMDKDELIRRLVWLQLRETIDTYAKAKDLNAGFEERGNRGAGSGRNMRLFINLGEKDGLNAHKLVQFITESTDIEPNLIDRVTVREMSSFFNVAPDVAEFVMQTLSQKKFKHRKVRLEEAEQRTGSRPDARPGRSFRDSRPNEGRGGSHKFNRRNDNKY